MWMNHLCKPPPIQTLGNIMEGVEEIMSQLEDDEEEGCEVPTSRKSMRTVCVSSQQLRRPA